jgi:hypothetical protein
MGIFGAFVAMLILLFVKEPRKISSIEKTESMNIK